MWGIVPDANCEGHFRVLLRLLHSQRRRELWHFLNLAVLTFDELGLPSDAPDREVWDVRQNIGQGSIVFDDQDSAGNFSAP